MERWGGVDRYDAWDDPYADERIGAALERDRLTHLVLVDGRLVDLWTEPVEGTRWARHAHEADRLQDRLLVPPKPRPPAYEAMLEWLEAVVGGSAALRQLVDGPVAEPEPMPETDTVVQRRVEETDLLLRDVAADLVNDDFGRALRQGLRRVWADERDHLLRPRSPALLAAGVCWVVGKANGVFGSSGVVTQARVAEALGVAALTAAGQPLRRVLADCWHSEPARPDMAPDLLLLGRPELLTASTRRLLLRLRDRATAARDASEGDVLPSKVES